jgi:hypothetical protein
MTRRETEVAMSTRALFLLALIASAMLFLNLNGCVPGGNLPDDIIDPDDDVSDDDDNDTGTAVFSVDASMPTVQVAVSRMDSEERTLFECATVCTIERLPVGSWRAEAVLSDALFAPVEFSIGVDETFAHTFVGGWRHDGVYARFLDEAGEQPMGVEYDVSTEVDDGVVWTRIEGSGVFEVEGDTLIASGNPDVYAVTLEPNYKFEFHNVSGEVSFFIRQ